MKRLHKLLWTGILFLFLISVIPGHLSAKSYNDSIPLAMAHFFDSLVPLKMKQAHSPGVVVTVVNNDSMLFENGYGDGNVQLMIPADPERTVWRLASISKVVTATAVMQLVEQGKLDLDRDVNDYLKTVKIPKKFGKPITLRNLLTHTAGFDDRYIGKSFRMRDERPSLQDFIKKMLPARIYPPGEIFMYSNIGNALAALVVQDVSGQDFNEYCRQHIFLPLGMKETSYRLDQQLAEKLYQGYIYQNGNYKAIPFDYLGDYPAGQLLSTAGEFSRFMMCQLNNGILDSVRILQTKTAEMMHTTQFTQNPKLNESIGLAFMIFDVYGNKVVGHNGGYLGLATRMWLLPGKKIGLFMATNIMDNSVIDNVSYAFVKRFFNNTPHQTVKYPLEKLPVYDTNVVKYTGYYRNVRYAHGEFTKMGVLWGYAGEVHIWKNDSGMLMMNNYFGTPRRLIQVQPGVFQSIDDDYYIAFKSDKNGNPEFLFTTGTAAFEKIPEFYTRKVQLILLGSLLGFFALILLFRLFYKAIPKRLRRKKPLSLSCHKVRNASTWTSGLFLLHWLGLGLVLFVLHPSYELTGTGLAYGVGTDMYVVQSVLLLAVITLLLTVIRFLKILGKNEGSFMSKLFYTVFILAGILYLWLMNYWNILGFRF
ncbi:MAG: beta-lactamase family protein [Bacteroidales bacterium]|nr:beta-lactamase family protein [Bacteroidales bacterium]